MLFDEFTGKPRLQRCMSYCSCPRRSLQTWRGVCLLEQLWNLASSFSGMLLLSMALALKPFNLHCRSCLVQIPTHAMLEHLVSLQPELESLMLVLLWVLGRFYLRFVKLYWWFSFLQHLLFLVNLLFTFIKLCAQLYLKFNRTRAMFFWIF